MIKTDLEWSDQFSTDIVSIDHQHQELLELMQNLQQVLSVKDVTLSQIQGLYLNLVDHALAHFQYEERIMRNINYPDLEHHMREHDELRAEISDITKCVMDGKGMEDLNGTVSMVQVWLLRHIAASDTKIRDYIHRDEDANILTGT